MRRILQKHNIKTNSQKIQKGDIFVCALGNYDKTKYIPEAIKKGAYLVISGANKKNVNKYLKRLLNVKYHYPLKKKKLIGITGTDGKTTTVSILRMILNAASIGTNGVEVHQKRIMTHNTTPGLDELYAYFAFLNKEKIKEIFMEVSSESYLTQRIPYLTFDVGVFLNISKEHLDKHKTMKNYLKCKRKILLNSKIKIINHDTKYFAFLVKGVKNYYTYGYQRSDLTILKYHLYRDKTRIWFRFKNKKYIINSPLLGKYNVSNLAAAIMTLLALGYDIKFIFKRISSIKQIPGRMEKLPFWPKQIIIDYAHTEKATSEVLKFVRKFYQNIITVLGCAGGRYREKRSTIGRLASQYSKLVIFTSDDPRGENPHDIIQEMIKKVQRKNYEIIINRREAIKRALLLANNKDVILILGKGRDNYMAIGNKLIPYSDIDVIKSFFNNKTR